MRGLEFQCSRGYGSILAGLLKNIRFENYDWYVYEDEVYTESGDSLYFPEFMKGKEFENIITNEIYLVNFINIQVYPSRAKQSDLRKYEDFVNSDCVIVLLICDVTCVEIYAKDKDTIIQFIENAELCGCENILIKTDKEDGRTQLSLW